MGHIVRSTCPCSPAWCCACCRAARPHPAPWRLLPCPCIVSAVRGTCTAPAELAGDEAAWQDAFGRPAVPRREEAFALHHGLQKGISRPVLQLGHARTQPCTCSSSPVQGLRLLLAAAFSAGGVPRTPAPPSPEVPGSEPVSHFFSQSTQFPAAPTPEPSQPMEQPQPLLPSHQPFLQPFSLPRSLGTSQPTLLAAPSPAAGHRALRSRHSPADKISWQIASRRVPLRHSPLLPAWDWSLGGVTEPRPGTVLVVCHYTGSHPCTQQHRQELLNLVPTGCWHVSNGSRHSVRCSTPKMLLKWNLSPYFPAPKR